MAETKLQVLLLQLPVPNNPGANIPLAAGYLKAYAGASGPLEQVEIEIMPRRLADHGGDALLVDAIVGRRPDVLGLSLYTWNSERSLHIASLVKRKLPECDVIVGGPEVQRDNDWVLMHPAVDVAVLGEGEQTFAALLRVLLDEPASYGAYDLLRPCLFCTVEGNAHRHGDELQITPARVGLADLAEVPSPYLLGYLELQPGDMALVECSRWCPYRCSFCLYGRNMGSKLGKRLFPLERVVAEVAWAREHGASAVHFVEANLNLLPYFRQLTALLREINPDRALRLYAELRGEHLSDEAVQALVDAGLHAAEVGLQSANPVALQAVDRRTDLLKWAAGARRLYRHDVEVFLDVILGLPGDDEAGVLGTLDWIAGQELGPYDVFTLQVLPGTAVRQQAARWSLVYQDRPPYYVLGSGTLPYQTLRALRWELKERAGFDPRDTEGMPELAGLQAYHGVWSSRTGQLQAPTDDDRRSSAGHLPELIDRLEIDCADRLDWESAGRSLARRLASHVTVHVHNFDAEVLRALCWPPARSNLTTIWDIICDGEAPPPTILRELYADWPHAIGYLDRVAVWSQTVPDPAWHKVTPRFVILAPWGTPLDPLRYEGLAQIIWRVSEPDPATLAAVASYGGQGIVVQQSGRDEALVAWQAEHGMLIWCEQQVACPAWGCAA